MTVEELRQALRRQPFVPFRLPEGSTNLHDRS